MSEPFSYKIPGPPASAAYHVLAEVLLGQTLTSLIPTLDGEGRNRDLILVLVKEDGRAMSGLAWNLVG